VPLLGIARKESLENREPVVGHNLMGDQLAQSTAAPLLPYSPSGSPFICAPL
jgi:hypothetical protein